MEKVLSNYGPYMTYLEQLAHTNSQPKKHEEIKGFVNKWKDAGYLMLILIFKDFLHLPSLLHFQRFSGPLAPTMVGPVGNTELSKSLHIFFANHFLILNWNPV